MNDLTNGSQRYPLTEHGLHDWKTAWWDLPGPQLVELGILRQEGLLADNGAFVVKTGQFTGRSPKDKYVVRDETTERSVQWGPVNQPITGDQFDQLHQDMIEFWKGRELFVQNLFAGADPEHRLPVRAVTQLAWHSLFARQLFLRPAAEDPKRVPEFTILFAPDMTADPSRHGTRSSTAIALNFRKRLVLIAGTCYAGEMKKSVFTILNYLLPERGVMPMHCSANVGADGDVALFFGLSGTGKTTLSADPRRRLVGDDEHGWSGRGIFNFEGGCYAKCIRLSKENEPQIWNAIRFGSVLENVVADPGSRALDYDSDALTENTRAAYPVDYIDNALIPGVADHPSNIVFLSADAFGVLPPISRLTPEQAMYHFLSGYTARVAGTERGMGKEPQATFSACFGEPFLPRRPQEYANLLGEKMRRHAVTCWLVNTGWVGGSPGTGSRIKLPYTRAMVNAAIEGRLHDVAMTEHPVFRVMVPRSCPDVPAEVLDAAGQWHDQSAYRAAAESLSGRFRKNFEKFGAVEEEIRQAAPVG